jgi:hypothetical protein
MKFGKSMELNRLLLGFGNISVVLARDTIS